MNNSIVLLDDVPEIRELLGSYLEMTLPVRCFTYANLQELHKNRETVLNSHVAILDLELGSGQPNGLDAFKWLVSQNYNGKIFFLTGHGKSNPLVQDATTEGAEILQKPLSGAHLSELIKKHLGVSKPYSDVTK